MKKIVVYLFLTAFTGMVYSQSNCTKPIPSQQFQQKYNQIKNKSTETVRLQTAKGIVKSFCFSSAQVKELASLFENDYDRYEFAVEAYKNTTDKENFYDVYDAFIYYSVVFRLHDFINSNKYTNQPDVVEKVEKIEFPKYNYPPYRQYRGKRNCTNLISDREFNEEVSRIYKLDNDNDKYSNSLKLLRENCLATAQLMKVGSLINTEQLRFNFAKEALNTVYDLDNYVEMKQIFNTPRARSEFVNYLGTQSNSAEIRCEVTTEEYQQVLNTLKNEKFNSTKVNSAKHLIQTKNCYTSNQIKGITDLFSYENSRLEIAMLAYDFVTDKSNYYSVVSQALGFESSKKRLLDHINSKNR